MPPWEDRNSTIKLGLEIRPCGGLALSFASRVGMNELRLPVVRAGFTDGRRTMPLFSERQRYE